MKKKLAIVVLVAGLISLILGCIAFFSRSDLDGEAFAEVCACGHCPVILKDGEIILAARNHSNDVGFVNGIYSEAGTNVILFFADHRTQVATTWDHLGLRCVDPPKPEHQHQYVVLTPRWKAYVHWAWMRMAR